MNQKATVMRIDTELYEKVRLLAAKQRRSINSCINIALEQWAKKESECKQ